MSTRLALTLGLLVVLTPPIGAQVPASYTLAQAVALAQEQSPQVRAAREALRAAEAQLAAARAALQPSVGVGISGGLGPSGASAQVNLGVSYLVYDGGVRQAQLRQLEARVQSARENLAAVQAQVALSAVQAYMNAVLADQVVALREQVVAQARTQLQGAQARVRAGTAPQADVVSAQAQLASAEVALLEAQANAQTSRAQLASLLGLDPAAAITVVAPGVPPGFELSEPEVRARALQRPEVRRAQTEVAAAEAALAAAQLQGGVTVSLDGRYVPLTVGTPTGSGTWSIGASVSVPLYDGGQRSAQVEAARANLEAARATLEQARLEAQREAVQAWLSWQSALARETAARRAVEAAQEALRVAEGRYAAGVGSILEVAQARTQLASVQESLAQATATRWTALAALRRAVGMSVLP
ncbi:MAG: TolC family protein [Armatimonadetes bacterium]|nr:TolC family protein [Armatimonadota bacterium]MDW8152659.1 TolC family protein [Armatimonadota bacterium]